MLYQVMGIFNEIVLLIGIASIGASVEAWFDYKKILKEKKILHSLSFIGRVVIYFFIIHLIGNSNKIDIFDKLFKLWIVGAYYWILFDIILNKLRGLPWDYIGKTSWIDRHSTPEIIYIKLSMCVLSIVFYLNYING